MFEAWEERERENKSRRGEVPGGGKAKGGMSPCGEVDEGGWDGKGKGKDLSPRLQQEEQQESEGEEDKGQSAGGNSAANQGLWISSASLSAGNRSEQTPLGIGPLVVLACRHVYHQSCLEETLRVQEINGEEGSVYDYRTERKRYRCPIDG